MPQICKHNESIKEKMNNNPSIKVAKAKGSSPVLGQPET